MSPIGSDGPSWIVTMPVRSSAPRMTTGSKPSRLCRYCAIDSMVVLLFRLPIGRKKVRRLGDDDELREVERVGAFTKDRALRTTLAAVGEERLHVLEVVAVHQTRQGLLRLERLSVAGEHVADLALRDRDERHHVHPVHERRPEVDTAAQDAAAGNPPHP